jgi:hypothetical protein
MPRTDDFRDAPRPTGTAQWPITRIVLVVAAVLVLLFVLGFAAAVLYVQ